jgi:serine/threonine-protein kinase
LRSEHVARVMDADSIEGGPVYLVMELLEGRDFGALLREDGPLPIDVAVNYVVQACEAVAEAHALGIVHRDITVGNLFLTRGADGAPLVKVLDFGLSRIEGSDSRAHVTSANQVMGTPHYMSPEQMRSSRDADARSDIWALGVVLYTCLAGRVPFEGKYLTEVCAAVLSGAAPPLASLRPDVPEGLAEAIGRCMVLEPEERFQSVAELVSAIAPFGLKTSGLRVARVERVVARNDGERAADDRAETLPKRAAAARFAPRAPLRWSLALVGLAVTVAGLALLRRASIAGDRLPPPATSSPIAIESATPAVPPSNVVAAAPEASAQAAPAPPAQSQPRGALRLHQPAGGPRRVAAPPPPAVHPDRPKADEDLIMGLPH